MTINAAAIIDSATGSLLDRTGRTWSPADKLGYLNEALRTTAFVKPDMYVVQLEYTLAVGEKQALPADGVATIDVSRNTGGRVITEVDKDLLAEASRFWPAGTKEKVVEHFTTDPKNPRRFVVFPPNDGTGIVDLIYGATPPEVMYATEDIDIPAAYQTPLVNFVLSKCFSKNTKRQDLVKADAFMKQWAQLLGLKSTAQIAIAPRVSTSGA